MTMTSETGLVCGITGTVVSSVGAGLSVNELQSIVSIVVTVLGFTISVLIPLIIKLVKKIKEAKENDGKIDKEELQDIVSTGKEIAEETKKVIEEVKEIKDNGND